MPRSAGLKKKEKKKAGAAAPPVTSAPETQSLKDAVSAAVRLNTMAIIYTHLAEYAATAFRGNDARGPEKLLSMPNGMRCRAELETVRDVEMVLLKLAADARIKLNKLDAVRVPIEREVVARNVPSGPLPPVPRDEGVVMDRVATQPAKTTSPNKKSQPTESWPSGTSR